MHIASFDIGKNNFAFCIEKIDEKELSELKDITGKKYLPNGTPTEEMQELLENVWNNGEIILHENLNLTKGCDKKKKLDPLTFYNMVEVLDTYHEYWEKCDYVVIEEQMQFKGKMNPMAVKLGQHCYSYFVIKYPKKVKITEFPSYHKTTVLGSEKDEATTKTGKIRYKAVDKPARKKWSIEKTIEILTCRGDTDMLAKMLTKKKMDDLADTFTQLQAFKYKEFVEKSLE